MVNHWQNEGMQGRITQILGLAPDNGDHPFGRSYMTAYQIAIELERSDPALLTRVDMELGGDGQPRSLARYVAQNLSRASGADSNYPIQGAFLWTRSVDQLRYNTSTGEVVTYTRQGTENLSIFRLRP